MAICNSFVHQSLILITAIFILTMQHSSSVQSHPIASPNSEKAPSDDLATKPEPDSGQTPQVHEESSNGPSAGAEAAEMEKTMESGDKDDLEKLKGMKALGRNVEGEAAAPGSNGDGGAPANSAQSGRPEDDKEGAEDVKGHKRVQRESMEDTEPNVTRVKGKKSKKKGNKDDDVQIIGE